MEHGHLFVIQGDLTRLAADHCLVPCDEKLNMTASFSELVRSVEPGDSDWLRPQEHMRVEGSDGLWRVRTDSLEPSVWLVDTTNKADGVLGLARRLTHALHVIEETKTPPLNGRSRALIAMPLVGIGAGGYKSDHAKAISSLMGALLHFCSRDDAPDVALVVQHRSDYAVLQKMRQVQPLPSAQLQAVKRMAAIARDGRLLLFLELASK